MKKRKFELENPFFVRCWKTIVFCLLILVEILILLTNWEARYFTDIPSWWVQLPALFLLAFENALKFWAARSAGAKIPCYVLDTVLLIVITLFSDGALLSTLYIVILSEFYLTQTKLIGGIAMGVTSIGLFLIAFAVSGALRGEDVKIAALVTNAFNDIIIIAFHFLIVNFAVHMYRKNREVTKAFDELNESNIKLGIAYRELQEVTALEERQRIAKDIHDTAGHAITTVIMQTEAAKLILDSDPAEAKRRIAAANLQAKNALEELRESVHLLSGISEQDTLKEQMEEIIHNTTDGTGITVRYEIDEISVCDAKRRFLCNTLKEGISNGLRHGGASAFWFELKEADGQISFLLSDNGSGVDMTQIEEGLGLKGAYRRAESLGGSVKIESERDEGFELYVTLPSDGDKEKV